MTPTAELEERKQLTETLESVGIHGQVEEILYGPQIKMAKIRPQAGTRARHIKQRREDLALALGDPSLRILMPLSGDPGLVALEMTAVRQIVPWQSMPAGKSPLSVPIGMKVDGSVLFCDIAQAPHILIAAQTGGGKSGLLNAILCSLIQRFSPDDLALFLIDPKQVELSQYERIRHLLTGVAKTPQDAFRGLGSLIEVMEGRYKIADQFGARSLSELNEKLEAAGHQRYPYIVCVIDELADLMMTDSKRSEDLVVRLAAKARAVGIHLIVATQSPRVQVVTGLLKANLPTRIAFSVSSMTDSRVILDQNGAQDLLGAGDGLFSFGGAAPVRFQAPWIDSAGIQAVCDRWR